MIQYDGKMLTTLEKYFIKCAVTAEQTGAIHGTVLKQNYEKGSSKNTDYCISHSCDITLSPSPPTILFISFICSHHTKTGTFR